MKETGGNREEITVGGSDKFVERKGERQENNSVRQTNGLADLL